MNRFIKVEILDKDGTVKAAINTNKIDMLMPDPVMPNVTTVYVRGEPLSVVGEYDKIKKRFYGI